MAIVPVGSATGQSTSSATVDITHGQTILSGDVVIVVININGGSTILTDNNGATSFTKDYQETFASATLAIFSRVAGASEPASYTFDSDTTTRYSATLRVIRGVNNSSVYDIAPLIGNLQNGGSSTTWTVPTITTTNNNSLVIACIGADSSGTSNAWSAYTNSFADEVAVESAQEASTTVTKIVSTAGVVGAIDATGATSDTLRYGLAFALNEAAVGPAITDVNTTNIVQVDDTPAVNGTDFLATGGTQAWAGESVGFSVWSDTVITSTAITRGDKAYDTNYDWVVTDNLAVDSSPLSVQLAIETGFQFVNLVDPINVLVEGFRTSLCYGSSPACVTGDQLRVPTLTDQGKAIDISAADGTFVITAAGDTEQTFDYEIWDQDGPTNDKWSLSSAVVINGVIVSGGIVKDIVRSIVRPIVH